MQIKMGMLEFSSNGRIKPIALLGEYRNSKGSVLDELSSCMQTIHLNLQYAEKSSIIYDEGDHVRHLENMEKEKQTQPVIGRVVSAISDFFDKQPAPPTASEIFKDRSSIPGSRIKYDLAPLFNSKIGDTPALLVIDLAETADARAQQELMRIVTGNNPDVQLGKNVIVAFTIEPAGVLENAQFRTLVDQNCTVFDMAITPQAKRIQGLTGRIEEPLPHLSGLPEYVQSANAVSKFLAAPNLFSGMADKELASIIAHADQAVIKQEIEKLERFVNILGTLEGGAFGADAISRGVDKTLLEALLRIPQAERSAGKTEADFSSLTNKIIEVALDVTPVEPAFVKRGAEKAVDHDASGPSL